MSKKHTIDEVRELFKDVGFVLLTTDYENNKQRLKYICKNGHVLSTSLSEFQSKKNKSCSVCHKHNRLSVDFIRNEMFKCGYTLSSNEYKNNKQKLSVICPKGHKYSVCWSNWKIGHRCPVCSGCSKPTISFIRSEFEKEGYTLLTNEYKNNRQKLEFICPNGHHYSITWGAWSGKRKRRCLICSGKCKNDKNIIKETIENEGYFVVSDYIRSRSSIHLICPNGHDYYASWDNWSSKGRRCPKCNNVGMSLQEKTLFDFILSLCHDAVWHDKKIITPYELDVVVPSQNIAVEYCGLYWHSELAGKTKNYHLNKLKLCEEKGFRLITIFEDELVNSRDLVFSRLRNILSKESSTIIYARRCVISEITTKEAKSFCNENHIQGYGSGADVKIGAFYDNVLVSVMTFSKPSLAKGSKRTDRLDWELHRFCSKINTRVVGIASKMLKYFETNYKWDRVFSYADRRWSVGGVYEKIGFTFTGFISPNYWYIKKQNRIHRFALRKTNLDPKNITEWEIRRTQGWDRIWDCGNLRYERIKR